MAGNYAKYLSYREAWKRINESVNNGFHFEAVTIAESIISDRLLSYIWGVDPQSKITTRDPFAKLIKEWKRLGAPLPLYPSYKDLGAAVDDWRARRNEIVHGLVKSEPGKPTNDVNSFLEQAEKTAKEGADLARKVSEWHKQRLERAN